MAKLRRPHIKTVYKVEKMGHTLKMSFMVLFWHLDGRAVKMHDISQSR
jgi:hypothetical protein